MRFVSPGELPLTAEERSKVWRSGAGLRLLAVLMVAVLDTLVLLNIVGVINPGKNNPGEVAGDLVIMAAVPLMAWGLAFRPRVAFDGPDLVVVNGIRRYRIPFAQIVRGSCRGSRLGVELAYRAVGQGRPKRVTLSAVQSSPADRWFGPQRDLDLVDLIERAASEHQRG